MKFRKTAVAVAVAGIAAAPLAASADTSLYGLVQIQIQGTDADDDSGDPQIAAGDIRFGINSEHELNNGLTGYGNIQLTLDDLSTEQGGAKADNTATAEADNIYAGIKGDFGDIRIGETPMTVEYGQLANDIHDVADDTGDILSYTGTFGVASIGLNWSPDFQDPADDTVRDSDLIGAGLSFGLGGVSVALGAEERDELVNASAGAAFALAGFAVAVQYWQREEDGGAGDDDATSYAAKVGYGMGDVSLNVTYSAVEDDVRLDNVDQTALRLDAVYDLGGGTDLSTRITSYDNDDDAVEDLVEWRVQLTKNF